jgi:hypothetical protein
MKRTFYYNFCPVNIATHFYVVNYDDEITIVEKEQGVIYSSNSKVETSMFFVNRFLKYYYDTANNCFTAVTYDYLPRLHHLVNSNKIEGYSA